MFFFSPGEGLIEHILVDISWIMVRNYVKRKKKVMLDEKMGKVAKGKKKKKRERKKKGQKKCSFMFLRFYVEKAWNQKKLSIGD